MKIIYEIKDTVDNTIQFKLELEQEKTKQKELDLDIKKIDYKMMK